MSPVIYVTPDMTESFKSERLRGGFTEYYIGTYNTTTDDPQAFLVHLGANHVARAHFHHVDQFQLFFGSEDTTFQRHKTGPLLLHYTDADTLYGPFASGKQPFNFFTLRPTGDAFQGYLPEDKDKMGHPERKRHFAVDLSGWLKEDIPPAGQAVVEPIHDSETDHLAAFRITAGPAARFSHPSPTGTGGQYHVLVSGEILWDGAILARTTVGWASPDAERAELIAGKSGSRLLILQFGSASSR
jgi:hypothetical protein